MESETAVTGDALIRQARQPPRESETAVTGEAWIRLPRQPPRDLETPVTGDAWIRKPRQPLGSQKLLSRVTGGFDSHTAH